MKLIKVYWESEIQFLVLAADHQQRHIINVIRTVEAKLAEDTKNDYQSHELRGKLEEQGLVCLKFSQRSYEMLP